MPRPVLDILPEVEHFQGLLAFVGLPDQVAALRLFQVIGHPAACKIIFIAAPFVGTNIYFGAISSFLRSNKAPPDDEIESLQWRAGEWPGALEIRTKSGTYRTEKFYYNLTN